ncbi:hypothetical protein N7474_008565 [Penicillium riverlandense]|uniref:uncharacterized protein n=1 Tax=Penicillium riverlandense TaxID=1903569 RepID=UPI00254885A4|nr:uncharacterized protein N7474_008565 [Penicillium riverlandense]KAJ5812264.1 hypothetical protein N7474_008565 [Penicillium riverlandense]
MSAPAKKEFLCILPDKPGAMAKRIEVRPAHLEGVKPLVASGKVVAGGAMLNSHPTEGETPSFKGSMMLAVAESEAEVRQLLANDIYGTSGVWDLENAQIIPCKTAKHPSYRNITWILQLLSLTNLHPSIMAPESTPSKGGGMMSLYANLLDPSAEAPGTISRAPVVFKQSSESDAQPDESAVKKQQLNAGTFHSSSLNPTPVLTSSASLRFQPTKRPQLSAQKPKPKPSIPKTAPSSATQNPAPAPAAPPKSTLADWAGTGDDDYNGYYMGEKRQRGGRKKRKKNREAHAATQNWDDIYDPSRPNNYEEYRHSDEKIFEVREWKDRLYAHRMRRSPSMDSDSEDYDRPRNRQFAPPSFAPPPNINNAPPPPPASVPDDAFGEDAFARRMRMSQRSGDNWPMAHNESPPPPPPTEPPAPIADDPTGEDAYMRRLQRSGVQPPAENPPPPPSRPLDTIQPSSATISRAPVRYTLPPPPEDIPASEAELEAVFAQEQPSEEPDADEDAPRSLRPGQKGFAERLLAKYGWTKGSGLGATGSGIAKPLQVKVEKQKKRPDSEGGGFATPAGRGKITGGKRKGGDDEGKFGAMSEVIVLRGMLDGMDLEAELTGEGGGLMQEIGEECSEKYGSVERVFIARDAGEPVPVFVKFTSPLSALRAVNALEGRIFNGNKIGARFFDPEKFAKGIYID